MQYRHLLEFTRQAEQALLDYLKLVGELPPDLSEEDLRLIREDAAGKIAQFTGFGIRDILETALEISANGLISSVRQMDHLVRVRLACATLQLGTAAAVELGALRGNSSREAYRSAAEGALSSLTAALEAPAVPIQGELGQSEASWIVVDTQRLVARTDDKARCLLTVKNFLGEPLANISVAWETNLSRLDAPSSSSTDVNGQVWIDLQAGEEMGAAQVIARFGLDRQILAPLVHIDCDLESLYISDPVRQPDEALAGNLETVDFHLRVFDEHGNPGRDQIVQWSTDLGIFERPQTRTDGEGFASARLRSLSSGVATVMAELPVNGEQESFDPVTFLEQLYFQYVRFDGPIAATQPTTARCRVVNLDGSPKGNVTVLWSTDFGGFVQDPAKSISNADGIAVITYLAAEPGDVTLTINARFDHKDLKPLSSARTTVHPLPTLVETEPAEQYYSLHQARPATFRVRLEPAAAGYPVTWWAGEELLATTYTSADGSAGYQRFFREEDLGERLITVRGVKEGEQFDFKVQVVVPHTRLAAQPGPDSPGIVLADAARVIFAVDPGLSSDLLVFAERIDGAGDDGARLTFTLENYADPVALGVVFDPPLGETLHCDAEGKVTLRIDCTNAAFLPNSDPSNNHMRLHVTSNLGTTLQIWVGLRYLLDLEKSELHFFRGSAASATTAGLSGILRRRNGPVPPSFREGHRALRATLDGASEPVEVQLEHVGDDSLLLYVPSFTGEAGKLGSSCAFHAVGELSKRVQFAGSNVFTAERIISDATLSVVPDNESGVLSYSTFYVADIEEVSRCHIELRDATGPLAGVVLLADKTQNGSIEFLSGGPTDAQGRTYVDIDTRNSPIRARGNLPIGLAYFQWKRDVNVWEMAVCDMWVADAGNLYEVGTQINPRKGRLFTQLDDYWQFVTFCGSSGVDRSFLPAPEGFAAVVTIPKPDELPVFAKIDTVRETADIVWLIGETKLEVTEDMSKGEDS
ncbi:Ig-like domain-containing protein [Pseudomonas sp. zfem002]|uniref:Ig-like domain-containing protein n=1 Tax=Pseudomonas sp. zfem002 TaxID=3078197 RepID=UPI0029296EF1|nr:Ig-like domain-containing protein [Pseudomonas sp. zfem002]MDU9394297.1 hypothetical protein [Pseudomonas sp. zfem002]